MLSLTAQEWRFTKSVELFGEMSNLTKSYHLQFCRVSQIWIFLLDILMVYKKESDLSRKIGLALPCFERNEVMDLASIRLLNEYIQGYRQSQNLSHWHLSK